MGPVRFSTVKTNRELISSILNWVCPECGGRLGGPGKEFRCQGRCQTDWRQIWEQVCRPDPPTTLHIAR